MAVADAHPTTRPHPVRPLIGGIVVAILLGFVELATRVSIVTVIAFAALIVAAIVVTVTATRNLTRPAAARTRSTAVTAWAIILAVISLGLAGFGLTVIGNGYAQGVIALLTGLAFLAVAIAHTVASLRTH